MAAGDVHHLPSPPTPSARTADAADSLQLLENLPAPKSDKNLHCDREPFPRWKVGSILYSLQVLIKMKPLRKKKPALTVAEMNLKPPVATFLLVVSRRLIVFLPPAAGCDQ